MAFTNIISGTIGGNGNIISADASFSSILSKFQVRYNGTGSWLECSNTNNITNKFNCSFELKLKDGETLTTMQEMFWNCSSLTSLDLSNLDTSSVTNMQSVFNNCSSLTSLNVSNFNTSQVTTMNSMFFNCSSLTTLDLSSFNTSQVTNMLSMFQNCSSLTTLDLSSFNTSQVTIIYDMFYNCPVSNIRLLYATSSTINSLVTELGVSVARDVYYAITILSELKVQNNITYIKFIISVIAKYKFNPSVYADYLPNFDSQFTGYTKTDINNGDGTITRIISHDTLKPTIMRFGNTSSITDREKSLLEIIECDTSNVNDMSSMFKYCSSLKSLDLSNWNTSNVTNMNDMFRNCSSLTSLDLSSFDTSEVTNMYCMFRNCSSLTTLDLSSFDTSNVEDMDYLFNGCTSLTTLDISNWNTDKVECMSSMFDSCSVPNIGLIYASSSTINSLLTQLGTDVARNIYYMDAPLSELTVQDNITYIKYELSRATFPYTLNKLPNGVADYIDVVNGVYVQRVGKYTTTSEEVWLMESTKTNTANFYFVNILNNKENNTVNMVCDKFSLNLDVQLLEEEGIYIHGSKGLRVSIFKNKLSSVTAEGFKQWVKQNPITVLYELATPIYTPLTEEEIAQLPLSAYADGYINLSSDQLMPSFEFRMKASNRYQVDMLETGYYYLNAPIGNVKLGTANVDVQQMPCIIKVDNVGSGDSGYRLTTSDIGETYCFNLPLDFERGYLDVYTGNIVTEDIANGRWVSDFIEIPYYNKIIYIINKCEGVDLVYYDENKSFIGGGALGNVDKAKECWLTSNTSAKYMRMSGKNDEMVIQLKESPITLAKLPSHRIPTTFTQGMKCGTDFGYWEGVKSARPSLLKTVDRATWSNIEVSEIENGSGVVLNRIEYNNTIVEDELDIATGKLTKRIKKIMFDGSDDERWFIVEGGNLIDTYIFSIEVGSKGKKQFDTLIRCDKFVARTSGAWNDDEHIWINEYDDVTFHIKKDRVGNLVIDNFKKWLQQNPITIYYELEVPEISYLNISLNQVKTVADTALQCNITNNDYLRPQVKPSHLTYPVPSLVGNRTYTVVHNRKNITGSTKPIELNLGGTVVQLNDASSKTLVKTPSTLAHSNLIFIGGESTVDHVMVLDGDWTNKPIEYFENMMGHDTDAIITIIGNGQIDDVEEQYLW